MFPTKGLFKNVLFQPYNDRGSAKLQSAAKDSLHLVQRFTKEKVLEIHRGCVNSVHWNDNGSLLLTAGDDKHIMITNPFSYKVLFDYETKHKTNIFCAKFLPTTNNRIISCGANGCILNLDLERLDQTEGNFFTCHRSPCYELETIPGEANTFLSCSEDGTIRQYDLRSSVLCSKDNCFEHILIDCGKPVSTMAINPVKPYQLAIATVDSTVRIVDRRKIITQDPTLKIVPECSFTVPHLKHRSYRITSLSYSPDGRDMLASYSNEEIYLFSLDVDPSATAVANDFLKNAPFPPPYRRIRLRGDWADTGPLSRPSYDSPARSRMQSAVMARMNDMLIEVLNSPSLRTGAVQNWRPHPAFMRMRRTENTIEPEIELDNVVPMDVDVDPIVNNDNTNSNGNNIEQSTSNSNNQRTEKKLKSKINKSIPGFDDFVPLQRIKAQYKGHRNSRTLIKEATFWGNDFIMSGSDCGHIFVWDRYTCEIVMLLVADSHVVNCIQPHPTRPLLATSGVDHNVKLWSPISVDTNFSQDSAKKLVERNKIMIEESRDTVTVSPSFIVRMLAYVNQIRRDGNSRSNANRNEFQTRLNQIPSGLLFANIINQVPAREPESGEEPISDSSYTTEEHVSDNSSYNTEDEI